MADPFTTNVQLYFEISKPEWATAKPAGDICIYVGTMGTVPADITAINSLNGMDFATWKAMGFSGNFLYVDDGLDLSCTTSSAQNCNIPTTAENNMGWRLTYDTPYINNGILRFSIYRVEKASDATVDVAWNRLTSQPFFSWVEGTCPTQASADVGIPTTNACFLDTVAYSPSFTYAPYPEVMVGGSATKSSFAKVLSAAVVLLAVLLPLA